MSRRWISRASSLLAAALALVDPASAEVRPAQEPATGAAQSAAAAASAQAAGPTAEADSLARRLVAAAMQQTSVPTIYDPSYRKIPYPMGDVPWYLGVCTDVVVRAYRALGIDLQQLVHEAKVGSGDASIDHRRVPVLMSFFARHGTSLPITRSPGDYKPGGIVTYDLPNGLFSKTHIAIVSDRIAPSGAPFVIHNRGWGVQLEDWLFAEKITGHYRYPRETVGRARPAAAR